MADLFDDYDALPDVVKEVLSRYENAEEYADCENLVNDLQLIGYTCEYGLDAVPHSLQKL